MYVVMTLVLIGIPGFYFGIVPYLISTKIFAHAYWFILKDWFYLNHLFDIHALGAAVKNKELLDYLVSQGSKTITWQWLLFLSHLIIIPTFSVFSYSGSAAKKIASDRRERELKWQQELEAQRRLKNLEAEREIQLRVEKKQQEKIKAEADRVLEIGKKEEAKVSEIRRREEELEKERLVKIEEIKGNNPWDSGFL